MRPRIFTLITLWVLVALVAPCAHAAKCEITDTVEACQQIHTVEFQRAVETTRVSEEESQQAVRASETGVDTSGANLSTNKKDFLSPLNLVALLGDETSGMTDKEGTLALDLNFILPGSLRERNGQLKLLLDTEATLFEPLAMSLEGMDDEDLLEEVQGSLGDLGAYSLSFTYNARSKKLGRYFSAHRDLFADLVSFTDEDLSASNDLHLQFSVLLQDYDQCTPTDSCDCDGFMACTFLELTGGDEGKAEQLRTGFEQAAAQEQLLAKRQADLIAAHGLKHFAALVDNQPQLYVSVDRKFRDDLVGPDEWAAEITYERPLAPNVNRLYKTKGESPSLSEYATYIGDAIRADRLDSSDRLSFSLKYLDRESLDVDLPGDIENFTAESSRELIVKLGWGRVLEANDDGTAKSRVDLVGSFEDVSSDPTRTDRALVTLTVSRDFGNYSIPLGIVYANKPEFLAMQDLDEQLSAHVGVKFNFDKKDNN